MILKHEMKNGVEKGKFLYFIGVKSWHFILQI